MLNIIAAWRREREAVRELSRLTDRELADLGISRSDIFEVAAAEGRIGAARDEPQALAPAWGAHLRRSVAA